MDDVRTGDARAGRRQDAVQPIRPDQDQGRLASNIAASMSGVPAFIVERQLAHFDSADRDYGNQVRAALRKAGVEFR